MARVHTIPGTVHERRRQSEPIPRSERLLLHAAVLLLSVLAVLAACAA
jgi:hypothetical protein